MSYRFNCDLLREKILSLREEVGHDQMYSACGMTKAMIANIVKNRTIPIEKFLIICNHLNLDPKIFFIKNEY